VNSLRWYAVGNRFKTAAGMAVQNRAAEVHPMAPLKIGGSLSLGLGMNSAFSDALKIGEVRAQVTQEFMGASGTTTSEVFAQTREMGYEYEAASLGMVVYNSTEFTCYYYDVYPPSEPESRTRAMLCTPTGRISAEDFKPLDDWLSSAFKQSAGPSWVDVGHRSPGGLHTNDLEKPGNYPATLPVYESRVKYTWDTFDPIKVSYSSQGGFTITGTYPIW
jgi:hypothetical protein